MARHTPSSSPHTSRPNGLSRRTFAKAAAAAPVAGLASGAAPVMKAAAQDEIHLVILTHWGTQAYLDVMDPILAEYEEANPGVTVEMQTVAFEELLSRITTGQLGGDVPDAVHFYNLWLPDFANSQVLAAPPDDVTQEIQGAYPEGSVSGATFNEQLWGYPTEVNVWQLLYNLQLFEAAGIESPPVTWDEFREVAEQLTQREGDAQRAGVLYWDTWDSGSVHPWTSLLWSNGGEYVADDYSEALFNSPEGLETLQMQVDMLNDGSAMTGALADNDFFNAQAAMVFMPNFWGADLRAGMQGGIENVGVGPIPPPATIRRPRCSTSGCGASATRRSSRRQRGASSSGSTARAAAMPPHPRRWATSSPPR
jgi:multiple sugar transport system substrate-binding protein